MATPYVAGIAAVLWRHLSAPTNTQVRSIIENSAEQVGALKQNFLAWAKYGRVNLHDALIDAGPGGGGGSGEGGDTTDPVISDVGSVNLNGNRFEITWATDEAADSMVTFVCCGPSSDGEMVTQHSMTFRGGKGTEYHYTVTSTDASGNSTKSASFTHKN